MTIDRRDWTTSASKWVVIVILGGASIGGIAWTILTRVPRSDSAAVPVGPAEVESSRSSRVDEGDEPGSSGASDTTERGVGETDPTGKAATASETSPRLININTASAAELELLPQIGPTLAARIVAEREANGPFASLEDIERVRGIGPRTVEKIRDLAVAR